MANFNYIIVVIILCLGLWAMLSKKNLIKKCIGMAIFQTGIILFFISMGAKKGATIPIIQQGYGAHDVAHQAIQASHYANPLTQILMLTAIVVGVATLGMALSLVQRIFNFHGSIEEDEILNQ
ncbi:MAG: cation:proton antiporter subunit C [bacterium]